MPGALAANCAGDQGKFWDMSHKIFENFRNFNGETLPGYAEELGLDVGQFKECLSGEKHKAEINKRRSVASGANVRSTPTFLLGTTENGKFKPKEIIVGAHPYAMFVQKIEKILENKGK